MSTTNRSRTDNLAADQSMIDGITKNQAKLPASFPMEGSTMTIPGVLQVFQDRITTSKAVITADNARTAAVKADKDKRTTTAGVALAFKRLLIALFAQQPDVLGDFGVAAPKKPTVTTATKASAAAKGKATRKTLGTKGTQQKKAALAAADAPAASPTEPPAPAASPTTPAPAVAAVTKPAS
jgi:hypothetical protein